MLLKQEFRLRTRKLFFEITEPLLNLDAALPNSGTDSERSASAAIVANRVQRHAAIFIDIIDSLW